MGAEGKGALDRMSGNLRLAIEAHQVPVSGFRYRKAVAVAALAPSKIACFMMRASVKLQSYALHCQIEGLHTIEGTDL